MSGAELCERQFQSTPPARGRLEKILLRLKKTAISIHAPREGGDERSQMFQTVINAFQSTPPRGGRPFVDRPQKLKFVYFNPRPREGGDGCRDDGYHRRLSISIHAPARGATPCRGKSRGDTWHFNPRPREGGDTSDLLWYTTHDISIHAPARGATCCYKHHRNGQAISIHAPARGATFKLGNGVGDGVISIHAPARGATAKMHSFTCGSLTNK